MSEFYEPKVILPREIWPDEAKDFTTWLAQSENLVHLSNVLNMQLTLIEQEINVGQFRADLLCRNLHDNKLVLIENQLEFTDHSHLGQIITYAAGLEATTIIWITTGYTEEHQKALIWLNENTQDGIQFFGVVITVYDSDVADYLLHFSVFSASEAWDGEISSVHPISTTHQQQDRYWTSFKVFLSEIECRMIPDKIRAKSYLTFSIGYRGIKLSAMQNLEKQHIGVRLYLSGQDAYENYSQLVKEKDLIERDFCELLEWSKSFGRNPCRVTVRRVNTNPLDELDWQIQFEWLSNNLEKMDRVIRDRIDYLK